MEPITRNEKQIIEFKFITGQDMIEDIKKLFLEYSQSLDIELTFQNFEEEFNALPGKYGPPSGTLILALVDNKPAGCIALRKISGDICEMKRLYVRNDYRGLGIGKKLITMLIDEAKKLKYNYMRLDTIPALKQAQRLYTAFGFYEIEPYTHNPIEGAKFLELEL